MATKLPKTVSARQVTRAGLAEVFGVTLPTVDTWRIAGCPVVRGGSKGIGYQFDTADVAKWLRDRAVADATGTTAVDEGELKRRRMQADTAVAELALAKAMSLVAPLDQMERNLARVFAELRANLRNIPGGIVSVLIGETDERVFKKVLLQEIDQALEVLADADLTAEDETDEDDE